MFMRFFGKDRQEQLVGIAAFVIVACILIVAIVVVVAPIVGDKKSETTLSIEIIKVLIALVGTSFGFLVGNMSKAKESKED